MTMSFKNSAFSIGGTVLYADQVTIDEKLDAQRIDVLGASTVKTNVIDFTMGSFSADFYLTYSDFASLKSSFNNSKNGNLSGGVAGATFTDGYITELSFSVEPLSLVRGSVKGSFIGGFSASGGSSKVFDVDDIAHGAFSSVVSNPTALSMEMSYTQSLEPYMIIGGVADDLKYGGGEVRCTIKGAGLQNHVSACTTTSAGISLFNLCNVSLGSISESSMKIISSSVSINESEDVVGTVELSKFF